jgi:tripartite-type tricarboxylate transporter receptor subunit TctC
LTDPELKARLDSSNIDIVPVSKQNGDSLKAHLDAEINRWGPIIRKANIPD